jgi:hypothetical protein
MPKKKIKIRRVTKKNSSILSRLHPLKALFAVVILSAFGVALFAGMNMNAGKIVLGASTASCASQGGTCYGGYSCSNTQVLIGNGPNSICSTGVCCKPKPTSTSTPKKTVTPIPTSTPTPKKITLKTPTNLKSTPLCLNNSQSDMNLKWDKVSGATGYNFYYKLGAYSNYSVITFDGTPGVNLPSLKKMTSLPPNQTVYWYVNAFNKNSGSTSHNSVIASGKTKLCQMVPSKFTLNFSNYDCHHDDKSELAPFAIVDTPIINLFWDYSDFADSYTLHWKYSNSSYHNISLDKSVGSYTINADANKHDSNISWYVTATNKYGSTNSSDPKKVGTVKVPNCN